MEYIETRLWIGNLDTRITEFKLLKILQQFGAIEKFDLLFHKTGPYSGQPRGYAFVTYKSVVAATNALQRLNGQLIGSKHCSVRLAKNMTYDDFIDKQQKARLDIPALAAGSSKEGNRPVSKDMKIQAIEAKLRSLEGKETGDDFTVNKTVSQEQTLLQRYQYNMNNTGQDRHHPGGQYSKRRPHQHQRSSGPYSRR